MFMQIKSEPARLSVMQAVAEDRLSPGLLHRFMEIKKRVAKTGSQRDRLMHGLWTIPDGKPDSIVWIDARHAAMLNAAYDVVNRKGSRRTQDDIARYRLAHNEFKDSVLEYVERDFIDIQNNIRERLEEIKKFDLHVWLQFDRRRIALRRKT